MQVWPLLPTLLVPLSRQCLVCPFTTHRASLESSSSGTPSVSFFECPNIDGKLRYLWGLFDLYILSSSSIDDALVSSTLILKNIVDVSKLIRYRDNSQYSMIMFFGLSAFSSIPRRKKRKSYAKNRWQSSGLPRLIVIPSSHLSLETFSTYMERTFAINMNRYTETVSPCLSPHVYSTE